MSAGASGERRAGGAIVVGGTGMLAGVCVGLAERGWRVGATGRRAASVDALASRLGALPGGDRCAVRAIDWREAGAIAGSVSALCDEIGGARVLVTWVHGSAVDGESGAASALAEVMGNERVRWVRVLGSAAADPSRGAVERPMAAGASWEVLTVVLGFALDGGVSRWLREGEIAAGVLDAAIGRGEGARVVGRVEPWSARPRA